MASKLLNRLLDVAKKREAADSMFVVTHHDADGISAAAILLSTFLQKGKHFCATVVDNLTTERIRELKKKAKNFDIVIFSDLGSTMLSAISQNFHNVIVLDHHVPEKTTHGTENCCFVNSRLFGEETSAAGIAYLLSRCLSHKNRKLAGLAIVGIVGDRLEEKLSKTNAAIVEDSAVIVKKGLRIFSATRPIDKAIEYANDIFIPGVTANRNGVLALLRRSEIEPISTKKGMKRWPTMLELTQQQLKNLVTNITILISRAEHIVSNLYLIEWFNKIEDAREIAALLNACGRLGHGDIAVATCMGNTKAKDEAESIYNRYKQEIIAGLRCLHFCKEVETEKVVVINFKKKISKTLVSTITSIVASSPAYRDKIVVGMANDGSITKISARAETKEANMYKLIKNIVEEIGGYFGGHEKAAGALIKTCDEKKFINMLVEETKIERIKL